MAKGRYTIYEAINEPRREVYVAATVLPVIDVIANLKKSLPQELSHWRTGEVTSVRSVEFELTEIEARTFLVAYARTGLPKGWRYVIGAP